MAKINKTKINKSKINHKKTRKHKTTSLYINPSIYQKQGKYGMGTYTSKTLPVGTVILHEPPNNIPDDINADYPFKLIKHLLKTKRDDFISMVPTELDETTNIDYDIIKDRHLQYLPELSNDDAMLYFAKYKRNAFSFGDHPAILFHATRMNHSCEPNITYYKNGNRMTFKTIRPIQAGDELFDSYINYNSLSKPERQEILLQRYGFQCNCSRCASEIDE